MKKIIIGNGKIEAPEIGLGCMRITGLDNEKEIRTLIDTCLLYTSSVYFPRYGRTAVFFRQV